MKTKLINAETAKKELARFVGYLDEDTILRLQIALDKLPAVEAIPVEWLKANYPIHGVAGTESYFRKAYAVEEMLKLWELQKGDGDGTETD